jgi:class 3 adenylate cyclase
MEVVANRAVEGRKTVTVLFCDLVAYTELAGRLDPEALRHLMLLFFERAAAVIEGHGGYRARRGAWDACTGHGTPRGRALVDALGG